MHCLWRSLRCYAMCSGCPITLGKRMLYTLHVLFLMVTQRSGLPRARVQVFKALLSGNYLRFIRLHAQALPSAQLIMEACLGQVPARTVALAASFQPPTASDARTLHGQRSSSRARAERFSPADSPGVSRGCAGARAGSQADSEVVQHDGHGRCAG